MTKTILILLYLFPILSFCQETHTVTVKYANPWHREVFHVLNSDTTIRHGLYQEIGYKEAIIAEGNYKNGNKDGIWTEYYWGGAIKKYRGSYLDGKIVGEWKFYDYQGVLNQIYDFTKNEIIYYDPNDRYNVQEFKVINGSDTINAKLDRPPLFIGGAPKIFESISKNLEAPQGKLSKKNSGTVLIKFIVDSTGKAINHSIYKGMGTKTNCDKIALNVIKKLPDNWLPGILNGRAVNVEYTMIQKFDFE